MNISVEFVISAARINQLPKDGLPEIAMAGRSNVGKSSLINKLLGKPGLARTSNTPGRTQMLNYFRVTVGERSFYLVDMPGYGFAAVNKALRDKWAGLMEEYLNTRKPLRGVIQLIDMRHPPQPLDYTMTEWLKSQHRPYLIVGTKADKMAKTKVPELMLQAAEKLNVDSRDTLIFSAKTGMNRDSLMEWILNTVTTSIE